VLAFASDDEDAQREFEAAWALTMRNLARGVREPLRPEEVTAFASSPAFRGSRRDDGRMLVGEPKQVAVRLLELKEAAGVDEVVLVTPGLDRARRTASSQALADAWRDAA
jgi:alkanesulfonate monooxygenase SsuD/methylene tetrahydromethanopterin reductase-like flavin-dependent oxidoreductase (luciferase family)